MKRKSFQLVIAEFFLCSYARQSRPTKLKFSTVSVHMIKFFLTEFSWAGRENI